METADLTELLKQEGSYTIFAPTDDAFGDLSREDLALLKSKHSAETFPSMHLPVKPQWLLSSYFVMIYNV